MTNVDFERLNPEKLTQVELAAMLGTTDRAIRRWLQRQLAVPRNSDGSFHLAAVIWWCVANRIQLGRER